MLSANRLPHLVVQLSEDVVRRDGKLRGLMESEITRLAPNAFYAKPLRTEHSLGRNRGRGSNWASARKVCGGTYAT
jgi:hypothetical protein